MRKLWLLFSQVATVLLACWFVVITLQPHWPITWRKAMSEVPAPAVVFLGEDGAPLAQPAPGQMVSFRAAAKAASAAVVSINTNKASAPPADDEDRWYRFFFGEQEGDEAQRGMGSGVIVSADGYVLTNNHVVEGAQEIEVVLNDSRKVKAKVIGTDPESDLAVLKINLERLPVITWGSSDALQVGDAVLAIGNPFGVGQTVTSGIVSALGRNHLGINTFENFIQTDAAINPGNSGGALVDSAGNLLGINTAIYTRSGGSMGIGFAIPASLARQVMDGIVKEGRVTRGWVGIEPQDLSPELAQTFGLPERVQGIIITGVLQGGPADKAGVLPGDVITHVADKPVRNTSELLTQIAGLKPHIDTELLINRKGRAMAFNITPGERPNRRDLR